MCPERVIGVPLRICPHDRHNEMPTAVKGGDMVTTMERAVMSIPRQIEEVQRDAQDVLIRILRLQEVTPENEGLTNTEKHFLSEAERFAEELNNNLIKALS